MIFIVHVLSVSRVALLRFRSCRLPARRDDEPVPVGIPVDEKVAVEAVTVQANPGHAVSS
jgi:hypothetical protein